MSEGAEERGDREGEVPAFLSALAFSSKSATFFSPSFSSEASAPAFFSAAFLFTFPLLGAVSPPFSKKSRIYRK